MLGHTVAAGRDHKNPTEGAFQDYTVLQANMAAQVPDDMPYENAAVLPLALSTAAAQSVWVASFSSVVMASPSSDVDIPLLCRHFRSSDAPGTAQR